MDLHDLEFSVQTEPVFIKIFKNGGSKSSCTVKLCPIDDDIWQLKKRILKKLKYENYRDKELQAEMRLFTMKGMEMGDHDMDNLREQKSIIFSMGDDFDYSVRVNALKYQRKLGKGGFGQVNLYIDELTGDQVAVKHLSYDA